MTNKVNQHQKLKIKNNIDEKKPSSETDHKSYFFDEYVWGFH